MKQLYFLFALFFSFQVFAQAPQKMSYQAVIRNTSGALVTSSSVGMKISILQGTLAGTVVYTLQLQTEKGTLTSKLIKE